MGRRRRTDCKNVKGKVGVKKAQGVVVARLNVIYDCSCVEGEFGGRFMVTRSKSAVRLQELLAVSQDRDITRAPLGSEKNGISNVDCSVKF